MKGKIFIRIGILFIAVAVALTIYNVYEGYRADRSSSQVMELLRKKIIVKEETHVYRFSKRDMPTIVIKGHRYVGWISIPSLRLDLPVMETWSYPHLRIAPCRYDGSIYNRDMVIAGHNYARHFSRIKGLENGTKVRFTDVEGHVFPYRITSREVLSPTQNENLIKKSDKWDLTMFTCTWGGTRRHVVRCSLEN